MSLGQDLGNAVDGLFRAMLWLMVIFVPLGLWKMVDIIIWCLVHIRFGATP